MEPLAGALARAMSDYSEEMWCAGWLIDLEYILWARVLEGEQADIKALADAAGGWIVWDDPDEGETFVPMAEWLEIYKKNPRKGKWESYAKDDEEGEKAALEEVIKRLQDNIAKES